jgi:cation:H+ antiporter
MGSAEFLSAWGLFCLVSGVIAIAGPRLSRNGGIIAEKTGVSGNWVGVILIATVTSLPELMTGVSAAAWWQLPDMAVGGVLGSCVFNLAILIVLDFIIRGEPLYRRTSQGHIISAAFGVMLIGLAGLTGLLASGNGMPTLWHMSLSTPLIMLVYAIATRIVFTYEREHREQLTEDVVEHYPDVTLAMAISRYALWSVAIVLAGVLLPFSGEAIAATMGWNRTFIGTLFIAASTSLPELVVTIAALRLGALNMAVAGLLGSNLFNIFILAITDVLYTPGPIMAAASPTHAVSAMSAVIMTGIAIVGLQYRPVSRLFGRLSWISLSLVTIYLVNSYVTYLFGH